MPASPGHGSHTAHRSVNESTGGADEEVKFGKRSSTRSSKGGHSSSASKHHKASKRNFDRDHHEHVSEDTGFVPKTISAESFSSLNSTGTAASVLEEKVLCAARPVQDFLDAGLFTKRVGKTLEVDHTESLGTVVNQLYCRKLRSCIVEFADGGRDFFDCMDLGYCILEVLAASSENAGAALRAVEEKDWLDVKRKLIQVAQAPIAQAIKHGRKKRLRFQPFDASHSLEQLLTRLPVHKRVPVHQDNEYVRLVTATDVLEMCLAGISDETKSVIERTRLADVLSKRPASLSRLEVTEDLTVIEVLYAMCQEDVRVVHVMENPGLRTISLKDPTDSSKSTARAGEAKDHHRTLVGQFDIAALCMLFARPDGSPDEGVYWWQDDTFTNNLLSEPCMDFVATGQQHFSKNRSVAAPYHTVGAEENLSRAAQRMLSAHSRSTLVNPLGSHPPHGAPRPVEGTITAVGLVSAMLEVGLFQAIKFDGSKIKPGDLSRKLSTLNPDVIAKALSPAVEERATKVKFNWTIDLECLAVPTCPEHSLMFMKYFKDDIIADAKALRERYSGSTLDGAEAECSACKRHLGRIAAARMGSKGSGSNFNGSLTPPLNHGDSNEPHGLGLLTFLHEQATPSFLMRKNKEEAASASPRTPAGAASPSAGHASGATTCTSPRSVLKVHLPKEGKKSKTAERVDRASRIQQTIPEEEERPASSWFGMFCCQGPCRSSSRKDSISTNNSDKVPPMPTNVPAADGEGHQQASSDGGGDPENPMVVSNTAASPRGGMKVERTPSKSTSAKSGKRNSTRREQPDHPSSPASASEKAEHGRVGGGFKKKMSIQRQERQSREDR